MTGRQGGRNENKEKAKSWGKSDDRNVSQVQGERTKPSRVNKGIVVLKIQTLDFVSSLFMVFLMHDSHILGKLRAWISKHMENFCLLFKVNILIGIVWWHPFSLNVNVRMIIGCNSENQFIDANLMFKVSTIYFNEKVFEWSFNMEKEISVWYFL